MIHKQHTKFETEIDKFLKSCGFATDSATYHEKFKKENADILSQINNPTSIYVRTRADRVAISKSKEIVFEWEAKTHENPDFNNITLEAIPLAVHIANNTLFGVECLYCHRNPFTREEVGFWTTKNTLSLIREIKLPNRWNGKTKKWFQKTLRLLYPSIRIRECQWKRGKASGDPFVIIDKDKIDTLIPWQEELLERLDRYDRENT